MTMINIVLKKNVIVLKEGDCNIKFKSFLLENEIIDEQWLSDLEQEHKELINKATKLKRLHILQSKKHMHTFMMKEAKKMTKLSYLEAIRQAHDLALEKIKYFHLR